MRATLLLLLLTSSALAASPAAPAGPAAQNPAVAVPAALLLSAQNFPYGALAGLAVASTWCAYVLLQLHQAWTSAPAFAGPAAMHEVQVSIERGAHITLLTQNTQEVQKAWGADAAYDLHRGSLVAYSALRDPADGHVRVFLDAEPFLAASLTCHFQILSDGPDFDEMKAVPAPANLTWLAPSPHARQRSTFEGYMLRLADPGARFDVVWLRFGGVTLQRVRVEAAAGARAGAVGACLAPVYTLRASLRPWLRHNAALGVAGFHAYHASVRREALAADTLGVFNSTDLAVDLTLFAFEGLHWYSYAPPRRRWYLGQSTLLNECLYRQRHAYDYLLFMDADEFLVVRDVARHPPRDLPALLARALPPGSPAASLQIGVVNYPLQCQADAHFVDAPVGPERALPAAGAHRYTTRASIGWAAGPKSAVRPGAVHHVMVNLVAPEAGFEPYRALKVQEVLIKQVHFQSWGRGFDCANKTFDDREPLVADAVRRL